MRKQAVITAVLFLLVLSAAAFGQNQPARRPQFRAEGIQGILDLTPEQTEALKNLRAEHQKERLALMDKIRLLSLENRRLMKDPEANAARSKDLRRQIFELREMNIEQMLAHRKSRNAILTPEQQEKLKVLESRRAIRPRRGQRSLQSRRGRSRRAWNGLRGHRADRVRRDMPVDDRPTGFRRDLDW